MHACGICHSDSFVKEGTFPAVSYPRVPGHELAGTIDAIGPGVKSWKAGQKVGVGWHGGHCGYCDPCRHGDFVLCRNDHRITGITFDGGYADYTIVPSGALALIPDDLSFVDAGPLMCAGVTTFNSLRHAGARAGDVVAVLGIGGLGHLGVQFAVKIGFNTVAIARGKDKEPLARKLGADHYVDSDSQNAAAELMKLGGARVVLATAISGKAMTSLIEALGVDGKLVVLGAPADPLQVPAGLLIGGRRSVMGWPSGSSIDSQETMQFSALTGVKPMTEVFPLERASEAYERMMSGKARFRVVLTTNA